MLDYHRTPDPDTCDVCLYVTDEGLDCANEHAIIRLVTLLLESDLAELAPGETTHLAAIAVRESGVEPGPVHRLEPRHWFWALYHSPGIRLALREE